MIVMQAPSKAGGAVNAWKNAFPFAAEWTERAVPSFSPAPSKAGESAKNWGQPNLSQGAINARQNAFPSAAERTERAVPIFSPHPLSPAREDAA
jgi:hypothetical protein